MESYNSGDWHRTCFILRVHSDGVHEVKGITKPAVRNYHRRVRSHLGLQRFDALAGALGPAASSSPRRLRALLASSSYWFNRWFGKMTGAMLAQPRSHSPMGIALLCSWAFGRRSEFGQASAHQLRS
jgi:hypothetical protein